MARKKNIRRLDEREGSRDFTAEPKAAVDKADGALKSPTKLGDKLSAKTKSATSKKGSASMPPPLPNAKAESGTNAKAKSGTNSSVKSSAPLAQAPKLGGLSSGSSEPERGVDSNLFVPDDASEDETDGSAHRRSARRRPAGPVRERLAANDDVPSIGGLIYALQQKPSFDAFKYAVGASIGWALLGIGFGWLSLSADLAAGLSFTQLMAKPTTFLTFAGTVVPIAVIWFLAVLAWRAEELRLRSSTMTEVAVRLAEPDRLAEQSVASLGQAVRRQVSFMNDAVSRALGRAGELEALVHNEVASLENSYEDNERKIRGLINELAAERSALAGTGGDFADTLRLMGEEVPSLIEKLSGQQSKLAGIIESAGDNLTALESSLGTSTDRLEGALGTRTDQLQTVLDGYTGAIDTALGSRTEDMRAMLEHHSSDMGSSVGKHVDDMRGMLGEQTAALQETLGTRTDTMRDLLGDYTVALADALENRTVQMETSFSDHMEALDETIGQRTDNLQTVFEEYGHALDATLANRAEALDTQLVERTRALDNAFNQRLQLFDDSIVRSTKAIDEAVGEKALALTTALDSHSHTFRETISQQASDLDESLVHGINAVRRSSENITRQSLKAIEGLAGQSDLLKNVSENLLGQINTVSNRFDNQTQSIMSAANALESANYKIDTTLRTRHGELSHTLDRMSGKADEFGEFIEKYSTSIEGSLEDAESRARAAAEELKAGALSRQENVLADIDRMRTSADQHSTRALEDLRKQFSTVSDELETQLGTLSNTVTDTTAGLRKQTSLASSQIVQEQERLRAELAAIPTTAREGTETMRRALQDQLNALERLTDISTRHAKGHEVSAPVASSPSVSRAVPVGAGDTTRGATAERGLSSLSSSVARELEARGRPRPVPANSGNTGVEQVNIPQGTAPQGSRPQTASPVTTPGAPRQAGSGALLAKGAAPRDAWSLGDLLHRASFDEAEGGAATSSSAQPAGGPAKAPVVAPPRAPEPKASGSGIDIVQVSRAVEAATAAQVWERLRAGHRGFLSRDMYTSEGRIVFDDIGYRFQSDGAVKASVLAYLSDFEQSLRATETSDPSGRQVHAQLMSDPGRVYLFLAHVSGRLG